MPKAIPQTRESSARSKRQSQTAEDSVVGASLPDLESLIGFQLRRAHNASARKFVEIMRDTELKPGQYSLLLAINQNPDQTQTAISQILSLDRSTMVPLLNQLERKQYVERVRKLDDRRAHALRLTDRGFRVLEQSRALMQRHEQVLTDGLSKAEREVLLDLLNRLRSNAEQKR